MIQTFVVIMQDLVVNEWLTTLHSILRVYFYGENKIDFIIDLFKINMLTMGSSIRHHLVAVRNNASTLLSCCKCHRKVRWKGYGESQRRTQTKMSRNETGIPRIEVLNGCRIQWAISCSKAWLSCS